MTRRSLDQERSLQQRAARAAMHICVLRRRHRALTAERLAWPTPSRVRALSTHLKRRIQVAVTNLRISPSG